MAEIADRASVLAWLGDKPREVQVAIAARASLRSLPFISTASSGLESSLLLSSLWMAQVSAAFSRADQVDDGLGGYRAAFAIAKAHPTTPFVSDFGAAFAAAAAAANGAVISIGSDDPTTASTASVLAADRAINFPTIAKGEALSDLFWAATMADAQELDTNSVSREIFESPLWQSEAPVAFQKYYKRLKDFWKDEPETWGYWLRWYEGMLIGAPLAWDLQNAVAQIPTEFWAAGSETVAGQIRMVEADWITKRSSTLEVLVLDDSTLTYSAEPALTSNPGRLARHLARVEDALDDLILLGGNNGLSEATIEYRIIKRLVAKYWDDPERVAFDLTDVNHSVERQIREGEYPDSEPFRLLQAATRVCISTVCDLNPEVAAELEREYPKKSEELSEENALVLYEAMHQSLDVLDEPASETTLEDIEEVLRGRIIDASSEKSVEELERSVRQFRTLVIKRQISRLWRIGRDIMNIEKLAVHYDGKQSKAAGVVMRYGGVAGLFWAAIRILADILGL